MERPGPGGNGLEAAEKGDFKKKTKNGLTYQIWFDRSHYNYIDYEIGHGNVEVGFSCKVGSLGKAQMLKIDHALEVSVGLLSSYNTV